MNCFYRYVSAKPSFPTLSSDVEDSIARSVRLDEEREILSRLSEKNTNSDEGEKQITGLEKEALLEKQNQGEEWKDGDDQNNLRLHSTNPERTNTEILIPGTTIQESVLIPGSTHPEIVILRTTNPESVTPESVIPGPLNLGSTNLETVIQHGQWVSSSAGIAL